MNSSFVEKSLLLFLLQNIAWRVRSIIVHINGNFALLWIFCTVEDIATYSVRDVYIVYICFLKLKHCIEIGKEKCYHLKLLKTRLLIALATPPPPKKFSGKAQWYVVSLSPSLFLPVLKCRVKRKSQTLA